MKLNAVLATLLFVLLLNGCVTTSDTSGTLATLEDVEVDVSDVPIEGGMDKALAAYQQFLREVPDGKLTPEAMRRLADLKVRRNEAIASGEYTAKTVTADSAAQAAPQTAVNTKPPAVNPVLAVTGKKIKEKDHAVNKIAAADLNKSVQGQSVANQESDSDFEARATQAADIPSPGNDAFTLPTGEQVQASESQEAIALYLNLLKKYPLYDRNDQVLYQLSRAYENAGEVDKAMQVMNRLVEKYPDSRHYDEVQFRRGEYYFLRKKFTFAEFAYDEVKKVGESSAYYEQAVFKKGWAKFKQDFYDEAVNEFFTILDLKASEGYDFENPTSKTAAKSVDDTFRSISLSFSYIGGPEVVTDYFKKHGAGEKEYEPFVYSNLGEHYFDKRRFQDAAKSYNEFVNNYPSHRIAPKFHIRVIDIYKKGGFPKLVVDSKRVFADRYDLKSEYWAYNDINEYPDVYAFIKTNLIELGSHFHALYQKKKVRKEDRAKYYAEAAKWYSRFLESFREEPEAPKINYQLADLYYEQGEYQLATKEYERTSYEYGDHDKAADAGYAAVAVYRDWLKKTKDAGQKELVQREMIASSLKFSSTYPKHEQAPRVLTVAAEDLYRLKEYEPALTAATQLVEQHPQTDPKLIRSAWSIRSYSTFELGMYAESEAAYTTLLTMVPNGDKERKQMIEGLAASVYKQGEIARDEGRLTVAADNFLRVAKVAPTSSIVTTAEYDAAAVLISLKDWKRSAAVLLAFRKSFPNNELQPEVTKKLAIIYKEDKQFLLAAKEFERIETETKDETLRREALLQAAELYEQLDNPPEAIRVYNRYIAYFPEPIEFAIETRNNVARMLKKQGDEKAYLAMLNDIVAADKNAGIQRTDRTIYIAAQAALVLAEPDYDDFIAVKLTLPFDKSLKLKQKRMKRALATYSKLVDYEVGDVTAAATYHIAAIYLNFSKSIADSERPTDLSDLELEQYNILLEDQVFTFEEKGIEVHEKNLELLGLGVYNEWIQKTLSELATLLPVRYAKEERVIDVLAVIQ